MKVATKNPGSWTDLALLRAFRETGEEAYFNPLFERYYPLVYTKCLSIIAQREESKDLTLIIFTKVYRILPRQEIERFDHWLYTVARRECLNHLRQKKKVARDQRRWWDDNQQATGNFLENEAFRRVYYEEELAKDQAFQAAIAQLSTAQQQCLELFIYQLKSYQEIATQMELPLGQVKSHLQNARRRLKYLVTEQMKAHNG